MVWTDVVQTVSMVGALLLVALKGSLDIGGASKVFQAAWDTDRIEMPEWVLVVGVIFGWVRN